MPSKFRKNKKPIATNAARSRSAEPKPKGFKLNSEQISLLFGVFFLIISLVLFTSFVSYLFTGTVDQDLVQHNFGDAVDISEKKAENALGVVGAFLSHHFIYKWFGISAFLLIPLLFISAFKLITGHTLFSLDLNRMAKGTLFYLIFISVTLGFFVFHFDLPNTYIAGGIGYKINEILNHTLGWGAFLLLAFMFIVWLIFFHGFTKIDDYFFAKYFKDEEIEEEYAIENEINESDTTQKTPSRINKKEKNTVFDEDTDFVNEPNTAAKEPFTGGIEFTVEQPATPKEEIKEDIPLEIEEETISFLLEDDEKDDLLNEFGPYDPKLDLPNYIHPTIELLQDYAGAGSKVTHEELEANKLNIVETMRNFSIGISSIKATIGPTVTLYEIVPEAGVRISKIKNLEDDIALNLAALGIRIIAPMPGKGTIGIEVPNKNREMVSMKSVTSIDKFQKSNYELPIILGKTIANEIFISDLAKMPHLLMAGATGQGKSVGLNVILASLLYKKHPAEVKFVLVDPKKVELSLFNKIERHFLAMLPNAEEAIITDTKKVIYTLNSLCIEMDQRYNLLKEAGVRNIKEYNAKFTKRRLNPEKGHKFLPYIVLVIDELADLMMTAGKEVEQPIARLAQLARAIGIHLIVATQRPSVNVITGLIKANFPARLSFKVTAKVDSRTILDTGGAEQLVGNGDMLLSMGSDMVRLQCPFVDTPEIEGICDFIGEQRGYSNAYLLPEYYGDDEPDALDFDPNDLDPLFEDAAKLIVTFQQGSTSLIQRKMKLGYNRAGRIIDQLEGAGIVGPFEGSKAREVFVKTMEELLEILARLRSK